MIAQQSFEYLIFRWRICIPDQYSDVDWHLTTIIWIPVWYSDHGHQLDSFRPFEYRTRIPGVFNFFCKNYFSGQNWPFVCVVQYLKEIISSFNDEALGCFIVPLRVVCWLWCLHKMTIDNSSSFNLYIPPPPTPHSKLLYKILCRILFLKSSLWLKLFNWFKKHIF